MGKYRLEELEKPDHSTGCQRLSSGINGNLRTHTHEQVQTDHVLSMSLLDSMAKTITP